MCVRERRDGRWESGKETHKTGPKFLISSPGKCATAINSAEAFHVSSIPDKLIYITRERGVLCLTMLFIGQNKKVFF